MAALFFPFSSSSVHDSLQKRLFFAALFSFSLLTLPELEREKKEALSYLFPPFLLFFLLVPRLRR